jgi:hypothetical protein
VLISRKPNFDALGRLDDWSWRGHVTGGDVTDTSSKDVVPQLIHLLHAFTEAQESLTRRVQDARLEHTFHSASIIERPMQAEPSDEPPSFVDGCPKAFGEISEEPPTDTVEVLGDGSLSEPGSEMSAENPANLEMAAHSNPPSAIWPAGEPADPSREAAARTDWLNSTRADEMTTESMIHDYNFFDVLDARLAGLQEASDRPEDQ